MKRGWLSAVLFASLLTIPGTLVAGEPYQQFLEGLRERRYYDTAQQYLDKVAADPATPAEFRDVVDYERALTHQIAAQNALGAEAQLKSYDQAEALLSKFAKEHPDHPYAATANTQRGKILLGKARAQVQDAKSPASASKKPQLLESARAQVKAAREIFQAAHDRYKADWETFPKFIPPSEDEKIKARGHAEINFIKAQLDLAHASYESAQTYDRKDPEYGKTLTEAAKEYDLIHQRYRSQIGGLHARMWMGKCFEEQGDEDGLRKALGIYNELLGHTGESEALQQMQDQALQFRLICLNRPERHDYKLVEQEALAWFKSRPRLQRTQVGLGVRWELAQALEQLGLQRERTEAERKKSLTDAQTQASYVSRYPGQYKGVSIEMLSRLNGLLQGGEGDPQDFESAAILAGSRFRGIREHNDKLKGAATPESQQAAQSALDAHLLDTIRMYRLALRLADHEADQRKVHEARYNLAYVLYLSKRYHESAVLCDYLARILHKKEPNTALAAAFLELADYNSLYNAAPKNDRDWQVEKLRESADRIATLFPESGKANEARLTLGRIYRQRKQPAQAAEWFGKVPESADQFTEAQIEAGQAYLSAYGSAAVLPKDQQPPTEELAKWQSEAKRHLTVGIERRQKALAEGAESPSDLVAAKASLVQLLIGEGEYPASIALLTGDPHSVIAAVTIPNEAERGDKTGIQGREFAGLAYQLLLRSYVGTQQIDEALQAMQTLEGIGGDDNTAIYVQLGQELQKEVERLKGLGATDRLAEVRASFDQFLGKVYERSEGQSYGILIWIAETYFGLGEGVGDADPAAAAYFDKAAKTYQSILDRSQQDPNFTGEGQLAGVMLRLVNCRRRQQDYEAAMKLVAGLLVQREEALDAQYEAANVLQSWGASGQATAEGKYLDAIRGVEVESGGKKVKVWGWGQIALRLHRVLQGGRGNDEFREQHLKARYNSIYSRQQHGLAQRSLPQKTAELEKAKQELKVFAGTNRMNEDWWEKFEILYQQIQKDQGATAPEPLQRTADVAATTPAPLEKPIPKPTDPATTAQTPTDPAATTPAAPAGMSTLEAGIYIGIGVAFVAGMAFMMLKPKKRRSAELPDAAPSFEFAPEGKSAKRKRPVAVGAVAEGTPVVSADSATAGNGETSNRRPAIAKPAAAAAVAASSPSDAVPATPAAAVAAKPVLPKPAAKPVVKPAASAATAPVVEATPAVAAPVAAKPAVAKPALPKTPAKPVVPVAVAAPATTPPAAAPAAKPAVAVPRKPQIPQAKKDPPPSGP